MKKTILFSLILLTISSCSMSYFYPRKIQSTYDEIKSSKRYVYKQMYRVVEKHTPVITLKKTFYKEIFPKGDLQTKVYDEIKVQLNTLPINDTIYLMADNQYFPVRIAKTRITTLKNVVDNTEDIMKADSSTVSVVTGHEEYFYKLFTLEYNLSDEQLRALSNAEKVKFRYYSGIHMITVNIEKKDLKVIKEWSNLN